MKVILIWCVFGFFSGESNISFTIKRQSSGELRESGPGEPGGQSHGQPLPAPPPQGGQQKHVQRKDIEGGQGGPSQCALQTSEYLN